jgi:hypothetical protein
MENDDMNEEAIRKLMMAQTPEEVFHGIRNQSIQHCIVTIKKHIPDPKIASGLCIDAITYELNLIVDKLEKLKG